MSGETRSQCSVSSEKREGDVLLLKLRAQLEELFSDSHLAEDGFLLKHIQKNKEGFVSLKLLTCLKKIKVLTDNWYVTLAAALMSEQLQVSDESNKVKRTRPHPDWLLYSPTSKLLLLYDLPEPHIEGTSQNQHYTNLSKHLLQKFNSYGSVTSFWLLHPDQELPKELQCYTKRQKELGQCVCVVVKFDTLDAVRKAYYGLKAEESETGIHVTSLGYQSPHLIVMEQRTEEVDEVPVDPVVKQGGGDGELMRRVPWVLRRRQAAGKTSQTKPGPVLKVLRQPYGPDGTKGFHYRRMVMT